jgi:hypothetical protein
MMGYYFYNVFLSAWAFLCVCPFGLECPFDDDSIYNNI